MPHARLLVRDHRPELGLQIGVHGRNNAVGARGVAGVVGRAVGQRAQGKGVLVAVAGLAQQVAHKIAGPHVVREVGEEGGAQRVVAHVLQNGPAVGVALGLVQLLGGAAGVLVLQPGHEAAVPGCVDNCLVGEHGVGGGGGHGGGQQQQQ